MEIHSPPEPFNESDIYNDPADQERGHVILWGAACAFLVGVFLTVIVLW